MIDHAARAEVRDALEAFLSDRINAREFDKRVFDPGVDTDDSTVDAAARCLWQFYDDFEDHQVCLDKVGWDAAQRIALLLDASVEAEWRVTKRWHASQLIAVGILLILLGIGWFAGWWLAALAAVLTSPLAFVLDAWRNSASEKQQPPYAPQTWPYDSLGSLRNTRMRASGFQKRPYRRDIASRRIRSDFRCSLLRAELLIFQVIFSPLVYVLLCFPLPNERLYVRRDDDSLRLS